METKIVKLDSRSPAVAEIEQAASFIKEGGVVAFPTETVYGLGADALNSEAAVRIYHLKNRELNKPLPVQIAAFADLNSLVYHLPETARGFITEFWPGPLTLVLEKAKNLPLTVRGGLESIGVRMPANKIALELIRASGGPLAVSSANISGRGSALTGEEVIQCFQGKIEMIIDGGQAEIGIESTVVKMMGNNFVVLREGAISVQAIEKKIRRREDDYRKKEGPQGKKNRD